MKKVDDIRKFVWIEFLIWFLILCFVVTGIRIYRHNNEKKLVTYQIFMPDVDGLIKGSPVKFMGVQIGYIDKIKIISSEIYLKLVITDKNVNLPKGSIATVEFNGMGGSKSLEIYPPTQESIVMGRIIAVQNPIRLNDSLTLLGDMFDKIDSIMLRTSLFADKTGIINMKQGIELDGIQNNMNLLDKWLRSKK